MNLKDYTIVIPARRNSKGLKFKNRKLMPYTLNSIPEEYKNKVSIATDDEYIKSNYTDYNFIYRSESVSSDTASTKDLMREVVSHVSTKNIIMLYLTYPERTWDDITQAVRFYEKHSADSLLCKKELFVSPYLMMFENGVNGKQIIKHNLYRRQEYPKCFEISHFICIFSKKELYKLNNNMYNEGTVFFQIDKPIDVDTKKDLEKYNEKNKNNC